MKTIFAAFLMIAMISGTYAGTMSEQEARQELTRNVKKVFSEEINQYKNFFYEHDINAMKEKVEITCLANDQNYLELVRLKCPNCQASDFVKHVFENYPVKVDGSLKGKVFRFNLELRYKAW